MTTEQPPFPDYYEVLGARPDVSDEELRAARREAVKRWHPDRNTAAEAEEMMRLVNAAWEVLGKPETRAEYDAVYFAWRAAEYARRAAAADEVRREYVRERLEREEGEAAERGATRERGTVGGVDQGSDGSSVGQDWDVDTGNNGSDVVVDQSTAKKDDTRRQVIGIVLVGLVVVACIIGIDACNRAASEAEMRSEQTATAMASFSITPTPTHQTIRSKIGDGRIECAPVLFSPHSERTTEFWTSVKFMVPTSSEWSVGYRYHIGNFGQSDAATFIFKERSSGPRAYHWTRYGPANSRYVGPEWIRPQSALNAGVDNVLGIEVNERGSYLILNGELQIQVPVGQLNPRISRVQFCVGFLSGEASEYELQYSDLTGGAR